jgi:hypothetical protein
MGPTQAGVALGWSQGQVSNWLMKHRGSGGNRGISAMVFARICLLFGLDPLNIIKAIDDPPSHFWEKNVPRQSSDPMQPSMPTAHASKGTSPRADNPARRRLAR